MIRLGLILTAMGVSFAATPYLPVLTGGWKATKEEVKAARLKMKRFFVIGGGSCVALGLALVLGSIAADLL